MNIKYIDLFFLHSPRNNGFNYKRTFMKLNDLKKEGKIKFFGVSPSGPDDALFFIKHFKFDYLQINFNLIDQRIIDKRYYLYVKKKLRLLLELL